MLNLKKKLGLKGGGKCFLRRINTKFQSRPLAIRKIQFYLTEHFKSFYFHIYIFWYRDIKWWVDWVENYIPLVHCKFNLLAHLFFTESLIKKGRGESRVENAERTASDQIGKLKLHARHTIYKKWVYWLREWVYTSAGQVSKYICIFAIDGNERRSRDKFIYRLNKSWSNRFALFVIMVNGSSINSPGAKNQKKDGELFFFHL